MPQGILSSTSVPSVGDSKCLSTSPEEPKPRPQQPPTTDESSINAIELTSYHPTLVVSNAGGHDVIPMQWFIWDCGVTHPPWRFIFAHNPGRMSCNCHIIKCQEVGWEDVVQNRVPGKYGIQLEDVSDRDRNNRHNIASSGVLQEWCDKGLLRFLALTNTVIRAAVTYIHLPLHPSFKILDPVRRWNIAGSFRLILRDACTDARCSHCQCAGNSWKA
jgi:hypothetical protein